MIVGETPVHERQALVHKFEENDNCTVAILSLLAASQGLTLVSASTVVFAELHWTPGIIEQVFFFSSIGAAFKL
jgi:SWI/SNF-related matrix-associated actin-dependent regulator 1 of chromatin subfamily A